MSLDTTQRSGCTKDGGVDVPLTAFFELMILNVFSVSKKIIPRAPMMDLLRLSETGEPWNEGAQ